MSPRRLPRLQYRRRDRSQEGPTSETKETTGNQISVGSSGLGLVLARFTRTPVVLNRNLWSPGTSRSVTERKISSIYGEKGRKKNVLETLEPVI